MDVTIKPKTIQAKVTVFFCGEKWIASDIYSENESIFMTLLSSEREKRIDVMLFDDPNYEIVSIKGFLDINL